MLIIIANLVPEWGGKAVRSTANEMRNRSARQRRSVTLVGRDFSGRYCGMVLDHRIQGGGVPSQGPRSEQCVVCGQNQFGMPGPGCSGDLHQLRMLILTREQVQPRNVISRHQSLN